MPTYERPAGSLISYMSDKVKAGGGLNLAQGLPGFPPPPELTDILKELSDQPVHQYAPGRGDNDLRDILPTLFPGGPARDQFIVTNGATEAITLTYLYLSRREAQPFSALAFEPVYESYRNLPQIFGNHFVAFDIGEGLFGREEAFRQVVRDQQVKIVFVSSPGNPLGRVWRRDELERLAALSDELDFSLIVDGVYREIYFGEQPWLPTDRISPRLFYADSFSKTLSITGWRVGFLAAHPSHLAALRTIHDYTGLSSPSVLQKAIARYLAAHDNGAAYLAAARRTVGTSFVALKKMLTALGFRIPPIDGGYFIWAELPEGFDDGLAFAEELYAQEKLAAVPGIHFSDAGVRFVRFNIAKPLADIEEAARRIEKFVRTGRLSGG